MRVHPAACFPQHWLILTCGNCCLQIYWSSLWTSGTSAGTSSLLHGQRKPSRFFGVWGLKAQCPKQWGGLFVVVYLF